MEDLKSDVATVITFVDDTNSTIKEKINIDLIVTMKENLIQSEEYTSQNQLALNSKKLKYLLLQRISTWQNH